MEENCSVLIVDDEVDLLDMYKDYFESSGISVLTAASGEEGISTLLKNPQVKLVISDANMGKMSGLDFLAEIKLKNSMAPIFYLATGDIGNKESTLKELGVNRLILKPFDLDEVIDLIKNDLKL